MAAFVVNLGTINTGMAFGFPAVALPQMQSNTSTLFVSEDQASWIGKKVSICFFVVKLICDFATK